MISRDVMEYPLLRNAHYGAEDKGLPNPSQAKNSALPNPGDLYRRIEIALGTTVGKEIAEIVGVKPSSVTEWKQKGNIKLENLITIARKSGRSLDWLLGLTESEAGEKAGGEGDTRVEFSGSELIYIQKLADFENQDYERMVYSLVIEALRHRSAALFSNYHLLPTDQLDELLSYVIPAKKENGKRNGGKG